jgi:hypothetical protein
MSANSIRERLRRGMSHEQAMTMPPVPNGIERKNFKPNSENINKQKCEFCGQNLADHSEKLCAIH